jgi:hypothetical protein
LSLVARENYLADLVSDLSVAFSMFSNEAEKLRIRLVRSVSSVSFENYTESREVLIEICPFGYDSRYLIRLTAFFGFSDCPLVGLIY